MTERPKRTLKRMPHQDGHAHHERVLKKVLGVLLIIVGLFALVTPFTPGAWLIFVGLEAFGIRIAFWEHFKEWGKRLLRSENRSDMLVSLIHKQAITAMETEVGNVVHYYDKLGVAIIELSGKLSVGDTIKVKRDEEEFEQQVASMQVEHEAVESAKKGDAVGVAVDQKTKEGAKVFLVTA